MDIEIIAVLVVAFLILAIGFWLGRKYATKVEFKLLEKDIRKNAIEGSRATLGGKFSEQLAPYLPDFKYDPTDVRFIGTPIDLLVFNGLSTGNPEEIVFLEIKSGKSDLTTKQRKLRNIINEGKIRWEVYQVPNDITKLG
ncbi:MAG: Holliday junction resolvase-like protein [Candidatus Hydrothermarchaeales archaeon]